jgi:hypothetical protein
VLPDVPFTELGQVDLNPSTGLILRWSYSYLSGYVWSRSKVDAILLAWS